MRTGMLDVHQRGPLVLVWTWSWRVEGGRVTGGYPAPDTFDRQAPPAA